MPSSRTALAKVAAAPAGTTEFDAFCGIDWAEVHHDWAIVDRSGALLGQGRIRDTLEGLTTLLTEIGRLGHGQAVPIAIETDHGLLVSEFRRTVHPVYSLNPRVVKAYGIGTVSAARSPTKPTRCSWPTSAVPT